MTQLNEDLTQHADFVVRLARSLSRAGDDAEAAAQEAMVAALAQPKGSLAEPRAWLAKVVRRSLGRARRGAARRVDREEQVARPERMGDGPVDQLGEVELGERLLRHVRELDPVYRDVLFQRYFERRQPAEIAELSGESVGTVKTRLSRGLELMRRRLDADEPDGRRAWLSAALVLGDRGRAALAAEASVGTVAPAGPLGAGASNVIGIGVFVAIVVGLVVALARVPSSLESSSVPIAGSTADPAAIAKVDSLVGARGRQEVPMAVATNVESVAATPEPELRGVPIAATGALPRTRPEASPLLGVVLDIEGRPLADVEVSATVPSASGRVPVKAWTDAAGSFRFEPSVSFQRIRAKNGDWVQISRPRCNRDDEAEFFPLVVLMAPKAQLRVAASYANGEPVKDMPFTVLPDPGCTSAPRQFHSDATVHGVIDGAPVSVEVPAGVPLWLWTPGGYLARMVDGQGRTFEDAPGGAAIIASPGRVETIDVVVKTDAELRVRVVDATGAYVEGATVKFATSHQAGFLAPPALLPHPSAPDDLNRCRVLSVRSEERVSVRAHVVEGGMVMAARCEVLLSGQSTETVSLVLEHTQIRGTLNGPDGPLARGTVEFTSTRPGAGPSQLLRSGKDGTFNAANLAPGTYAIAAQAPGLARTEFGTASTGCEPLSLTLAMPRTVRIRFDLDLPGTALSGARVWWTPATQVPSAPVSAPELTANAFRSRKAAHPCGSDIGHRNSHRRCISDDPRIEFELDPGIYLFEIDGRITRDFAGTLRFSNTAPLRSRWVEVLAGAYEFPLELASFQWASWEGQIQSARGGRGATDAGFRRLGIALIGEDGEPTPFASAGTSGVHFVHAQWNGLINAKELPVGTREVWIGTEAQIEADAPLARHLVEFKAGINELTLTY